MALDALGDVQAAQGDLPAALASYQASHAIAERLAQADPGNAEWQRDLSVSHDEDRRRAGGAGKPAGSADELPGRARDRRAPGAGRSSNAEWQRDLSVSHNKIGDVQVAQGDLPAALTSYRAAHRDRRAPGAGRSGQREVAARPVESSQQDRRRADGAGQPAGGAHELSGVARDRGSAWRRPIRATPSGSATCRCRTQGSATCRRHRGTCRQRSRATGLRRRSLNAWRRPIRATPAGSATCRCRTQGSATCSGRRAICRRRSPATGPRMRSSSVWRRPIRATRGGSATCRSRT